MKCRKMTVCLALCGLIAGAEAAPPPDLVIVNPDISVQGEARVTSTNGIYETTGSITKPKTKAGEYMKGSLARAFVKFPLQLTDLGDKTTNDIDRVVLRMYLNENFLSNSPSTHLEVFSSQIEAVDEAVATNDFENPNYTWVTNWSSIDGNSPWFAWYEVDVTDAVLDDLANDVQNSSAGSCFRLQLSNDTSLDGSNNSIYPDGLVLTRFDVPGTTNAPQLRIVWNDIPSIPPPWLPEGGLLDDNDNDGINNLQEYALGGNVTNSSILPMNPVLSTSSTGIDLIHVKRTDDSRIAYTLQTSTNLPSGLWTALPPAITGTNIINSEYSIVTNTFSVDNKSFYIRLLVTYE